MLVPTNCQILENASIATMASAEGYGLIENGCLVLEGNQIAWVGQTDTLPDSMRRCDTAVFDCEGSLITPGLIDCHTHLIYGGNRAEEFEQRLTGVSYQDIANAGGGIASTVRATRNASIEQLVEMASPRLRTLMQEGTTTVEIKSGYGLNTESEIRMLQAADQLARQAGVNLQRTFLAAHALPEEYRGRSDDYIDAICQDMLPAAIESGLVDAVDAFCETIGFSVSQVERVFDRAADFNLPIKCHAEQLSDLGGAAMSAERGALSVDHLEFLNAMDVDRLAQSETIAVLLPGAFYVLKETQLPPIEELRNAGVPMALATDANPGSSPIFSPLLIMNMACTLFAMTPIEALAGFTREAARALGMQNRIGTIEENKQADLVLWDCTHPAELSYHIGLNPCRRVMQNGQWRMNKII